MDKHKQLIELQQKARKKLIQNANKQSEKLIKILKRYEADIISDLAKQPKGSFQGFLLQKILKKIEERTDQLKEELYKSQAENSKQTFKMSVEEARKLLKESFSLSIKEEKALQNLFNQIPEEALLFLDEYNLKLSGDLSKDIYKRIKQKLQLGLIEGKTIPQMARDIFLENLPAIEPFKNPYDRAKTIARTETARAYHNGHILTYKKFQVEEIIVICGKTPCVVCLSHCGTIHKIDYADQVLKHPNCTCTFAPIKRKGKILSAGDYYKKQKDLTEKKEWTLKTTKQFYKHTEKRFKSVKTEKEAIEVFKNMFPSEKEFYKHINRHILNFIYNNEQSDWLKARELDYMHQHRFSKEFLELFIKTITKPSILLFQKREKSPLHRALIYSKLNTITVIIENNNILSVMFNKDRSGKNRTLKEFINEEKRKGEILEVGIDEEFKDITKQLESRIKRIIS